jgi:hypothetical protein
MAADMQVIEVKTTVEWRVWRSPSSGRWIAVCDAMNLAMEADSLDELYSITNEAMHVLLTDLLEDNELDQFLRERGWATEHVPGGARGRNVGFKVPWSFSFPEQQGDPEHRAH